MFDEIIEAYEKCSMQIEMNVYRDWVCIWEEGEYEFWINNYSVKLYRKLHCVEFHHRNAIDMLKEMKEYGFYKNAT